MSSTAAEGSDGDHDLAPGPVDERWERRPVRSLIVSVLRPLGVMVLVVLGLLRRSLQDWLAGEPIEVGLLTVLGPIALAVSVILVVHQVLMWRRSRWSITDAGLHTRRGGLSRVATTYVPSRIDGVDIDEPVLERLVGLSTVRVEVSGGAESSAELVGVPRARAESLRTELLALRRSAPAGRAETAPTTAPTVEADGAAPTVPPDAAADDEGSVVLALDEGRARRFLLRSPGLWLLVLAVLAGLAVAAVLAVREGWVAAVPVLLVSGAWGVGTVRSGLARWRAVATLQIRERTDGLVVSRGRLHRQRTTIRRGRVAAVQLTQGPVRRASGWWEVTVAVTAFGATLGSESSATVCSVATPQEVAVLLGRLMPELDKETTADLVEAMAADRPDGSWDRPPRSARWFVPIARRSVGLSERPAHLLTRTGRWRRTIRVLDRRRVQTVAVDAGPLERRLGVATLRVRLPMGPTRTTTIPCLESGRAHELFGSVALHRTAVRPPESALGALG